MTRDERREIGMWLGLLVISMSVGIILILTLTRTSTSSEDETLVSPSPFAGLMSFAVVLLFGYQLVFNYLSESQRQLLAVAVSGFVLVAAMVSCLTLRPERRVGIIWGATAVLFAVAATSWIIGVGVDDPLLFWRKYFPLVLAGCLLRNPSVLRARFVASAAAVTASIGSLISLSGGTGYHGDVTRLEPFTGGLDGTHSSSYILVSCLIIMIEARLAGQFSTRALVVAGALSLLALVGLAVGTAFILLATYVAIRFWSRVRSLGPRLVAVVLMGAALVALGLQRQALHDDAQYRGNTTGINSYSSGRISTWGERLDLFATRPTRQAVLGLGVGTDLYSSQAWSELKNSHEDFLTILLENGIVGLIAVAFAIGGIFRDTGPGGRAAGIAFLLAALTSNALLSRPMIESIFLLGVVLAVQRRPTVGDLPPTKGGEPATDVLDARVGAEPRALRA